MRPARTPKACGLRACFVDIEIRMKMNGWQASIDGMSRASRMRDVSEGCRESVQPTWEVKRVAVALCGMGSSP
jgi:hypothetical protein